MKRSEFLARLLVLVGLILVPIPLIVRFSDPAIELHASMAESGGWTPDSIRVRAGEPFHLRLTSNDVMHGFAVGRMDMQPVDVLPGKITDLILTIDQPGTYTFYCTRWCGLNHWRMRGTIEVTGVSDAPVTDPAPLYVTLGLDLDAPHTAPVAPKAKPSAENGRALAGDLPLFQYSNREYYRSHSPARAYLDVRTDPAFQSLSDAQVWDVVAYLWISQTTPEALDEGQKLYAQNCAACHGEYGAGDGVFADELAEAGEAASQSMNGRQAMSMQRPVDFTNSENMLGASPALLQGKILRGGMGSGMPMWGVILTEDQLWDMVAYLYTFQFQEVQ
jgi:mono/diheme cytochrome c family protein